MRSIAALLLAVAATLSPADADSFDYSAYPPSTFASALASRQRMAGVDYQIEAGNVKYSVVGTYTGHHRELEPGCKELVRRWSKSLHHPAVFGHEIEVSFDGKAHWLTIQNTLIQSFASEIQSGKTVKLFVMLLGATKDRWVFAVNEFQAQ
jgi:hypothetical protein